MAELERIVARIEADTAQLRSELGRAQRSTQDFTSRSGKAVQSLGRRMDDLRKRIFNVRNALIAAAGVTAMGIFIQRSIAAADAIGKTAKATGLSAEALQEWRFAAGRAGVETNELDRAMVRFNRTLGQAQRGMGTQEKLFQELGVAVRDANGNLRDGETVLREVSQAMSQLNNDSAVAAFGMEIFGDRTGRMAQFLAQGSGEIDRLRLKARQLGVVLDNETIKKAEQANDELGDMAEVLRTAGLRIGLEFMPVLRELANTMTSPAFIQGTRDVALAMRDLVRFLTENSETVLRVVGAITGLTLAGRFGPKGALVGMLIGGFSPEILRFLSKDVEDLTSEVDGLADSLGVFGDIGPNALDELGIATFATAEEVRKLAQELEFQNLGMTQLLGRYRESSAAAQELRDDLELENEARQRNIDLSTEQGRAWSKAFREGQRLSKTLADVERITASVATEQERLNDELLRLEELKPHLSAEVYARAVENVKKQLDDLEKTSKSNRDTMRDLGATFESAFEQAVVSGRELSDVLRGLEQDLMRIFLRRAVTGPIFAALFGDGEGGGIFENLFGFASGGRPPVGRPSIVGERGPELFVPDVAGRIIPNHALGGGDGSAGGGSRVQVNVHAPPGSQVTEQRDRVGDMERVNVFIDQAVGDLARRPGTKTHRALRDTFGLRQQVTTR